MWYTIGKGVYWMRLHMINLFILYKNTAAYCNNITSYGLINPNNFYCCRYETVRRFFHLSNKPQQFLTVQYHFPFLFVQGGKP